MLLVQSLILTQTTFIDSTVLGVICKLGLKQTGPPTKAVAFQPIQILPLSQQYGAGAGLGFGNYCGERMHFGINRRYL